MNTFNALWTEQCQTKNNYEECCLLGCGAMWVYYKTDISEEWVASIFRVEEITWARSVRQLPTNWLQWLQCSPNCIRSVRYRLILSFAHIIPSTLKMEATRSSEKSAYNKPQGTTSQKTTFFTVTTVKTSNPMKDNYAEIEYSRRDPSHWPRGTLYPQKLALTSPTSSGCSVGSVRSWTQAMEFIFSLINPLTIFCHKWLWMYSSLLTHHF
jgi:hypothetical protein